MNTKKQRTYTAPKITVADFVNETIAKKLKNLRATLAARETANKPS